MEENKVFKIQGRITEEQREKLLKAKAELEKTTNQKRRAEIYRALRG